MRVAVLRFPGSNCDQDAYYALKDDCNIDADYVWHEDSSLDGFDAAFVPGGFSYGDYLRCGAMAARSPIIDEVIRFAKNGKPVIGACNGFQILCEAGLLPGALLLNRDQKFICQDVFLKAVNTKSIWTSEVNRIIRIPIAHGEGRYVIDDDGLKSLQDHDQIAFQYTDINGSVTKESNVNGSVYNIAGVLNQAGNVLGLMPHPERATKTQFGYGDGHLILSALRLVSR